MSQFQKDLATLNATGNGALTGAMGNAGTGTGLLAGLGADLGVDATNSMGAFTDEEVGSTERFEVHEESYDFTASKGSTSSPGRMGTLSTDAGSSLREINANNFSA